MQIKSIDKLIAERLKVMEFNPSSFEFAKKLFRSYPPYSAIFETNAHKHDFVDVSILLSRSLNEFKPRLLTSFENIIQDLSGWLKIMDFIKKIDKNKKYIGIKYLWLEFDQKYYSNGKTLSPGIYIKLTPQYDSETEVAKIILMLLGGKIWKLVKTNYFKFSRLFDKSFLPIHIGYFQNRDKETIRIVLKTNFERLISLPNYFKFQNNYIIEFIIKSHKALEEEFYIHFNIQRDGISLQGVELFPHAIHLDSFLQTALDYGWCNIRDAELIQTWTAANSINNDIILDINENKRFYPDYYTSRISHFKIINSTLKEAKIYLHKSFYWKLH